MEANRGGSEVLLDQLKKDRPETSGIDAIPTVLLPKRELSPTHRGNPVCLEHHCNVTEMKTPLYREVPAQSCVASGQSR